MGMHRARDTYSLTDFKQNARQHLRRLRESGGAEVLTVNGRAEAVVMTPETYDRLIEAALADVRGKVAIGLQQAREGRLIDGEQALAERRSRRTKNPGAAD